MKTFKKKKTILKLFLSATPVITGAILLTSCSQTTNKQEKDSGVQQSNSIDASINRDGSLIGEELRAKVNDTIANANFTMTDKARDEYSSLTDDIARDEYINGLWEKIIKWFSKNQNSDDKDRFFFTPEDLRNADFNEYIKVYIPNLEYFAGNHNVKCYFGYNSEKRNIFYFFKIKCLDGKQTEGHGFVDLTLPIDK
ncbi:hypothetical protein ACWXVP_00380 [Mycoplasma sp. 1781]